MFGNCFNDAKQSLGMPKLVFKDKTDKYRKTLVTVWH